MTTKKKRSEQRLNRRELYKVVTGHHHNLADLLTNLLTKPAWTPGFPQKLREEFENHQHDLTLAATIGWWQGLTAAPPLLTAKRLGAWAKLQISAHRAGHDLGQARRAEIEQRGHLMAQPRSTPPEGAG